MVFQSPLPETHSNDIDRKDLPGSEILVGVDSVDSSATEKTAEISKKNGKEKFTASFQGERKLKFNPKSTTDSALPIQLTLSPGDVLYLPRGINCSTSSLSRYTNRHTIRS